MKTEIYCPCCESKLEVTHRDNYQDLSEHVSQPNDQPSMKDGYQCPNTDCIANICDVSWIEDGDYYTGKRPEGITYSQLNDALKEKHGTAHAVNSWNFHYELGKQAIKKKTWKINLYWYKFNFIPKELGYDYPEEKQYQPHLWKKKIEIWKKSSDHGYTNVIPFWRMTRYSLGEFKRSYRNWKVDGNQRSLKSAFCTAHSLSEYGMYPDKRFYSRLTAFLIQALQPNRVKAINKAMENK